MTHYARTRRLFDTSKLYKGAQKINEYALHPICLPTVLADTNGMVL